MQGLQWRSAYLMTADVHDDNRVLLGKHFRQFGDQSINQAFYFRK